MSPIEFAALSLGYVVMVAGGIAIAGLIVWQGLEMALRAGGLTKLILQWYSDKLRRERSVR